MRISIKMKLTDAWLISKPMLILYYKVNDIIELQELSLKIAMLYDSCRTSSFYRYAWDNVLLLGKSNGNGKGLLDRAQVLCIQRGIS